MHLLLLCNYVNYTNCPHFYLNILLNLVHDSKVNKVERLTVLAFTQKNKPDCHHERGLKKIYKQMVPGPWDVKNIWAWGIWLGEWQNKIKLIIPYHTNTKAMNKQNNNYKNYEDDEDNNK